MRSVFNKSFITIQIKVNGLSNYTMVSLNKINIVTEYAHCHHSLYGAFTIIAGHFQQKCETDERANHGKFVVVIINNKC